MRPIYKILSVLSILILIGTVYAATQSSYTYTGCLAANTTLQISNLDKGTFYNVQPGGQPISACKPGDYLISLYDQVQIDSLMNAITNQINSLTTRISALENNPYPRTFNKATTYTGITTPNQWTELTEYTFYLPINADVQIEGYGSLDNFEYYSGIYPEVDGVTIGYAWFGDGSPNSWWTNWDVPVDMKNMDPGYHTVRFYGEVYGVGGQYSNVQTWTGMYITALDPTRATSAIASTTTLVPKQQAPPLPNSTK